MNVAGVVAYAALAAFLGAGLGWLMARIFYRPGTSRGPTQRVRHVIWAIELVVLAPSFVILGFASTPDPGTSIAQQRALGVGLGIGYAFGSLTVARRRQKQATARRLAGEARRGASAESARQSGWLRRKVRLVVRIVVRIVDYWLGVGLCAGVLIGGTEAGNYLKSWERARGWSVLMVLATVHAGSFVYGQFVSSLAIGALNSAIREDWRVGRRARFWLASGPWWFLAPILIVPSPGAAVGLIAQLLALYAGHRHTTAEPAGPWATLKLLRAARSERIKAERQKAARHHARASRVQGRTALAASNRASDDVPALHGREQASTPR